MINAKIKTYLLSRQFIYLLGQRLLQHVFVMMSLSANNRLILIVTLIFYPNYKMKDRALISTVLRTTLCTQRILIKGTVM